MRPVIQDVEEAGADQPTNDDPNCRVVDLFFVEASALGFARRQPNPEGNRRQDDQAVPTDSEMTDIENDGIDAYCEHLKALL